MIRILVVNPSFGSDIERAFWNLVGRGCESGDLHVHAFSMRKVTHPEAFDGETHTARLVDYGRGTSSQVIEQLRVRHTPSWWPTQMSEVQVDWERRRWPETTDQLYALRGIQRLASMAEEVLDTIEPDLVLTTNKIDHPCVIFRNAAKARSISTALVERSPVAGIWLEPNGLFAESSIPHAWDRAQRTSKHAALGAEVLDYLRAEPATFRAAEDKDPAKGDELQSAAARPTLLLLMDNALWTGWAQPEHPQRLVDYPYLHESPQQALTRVCELAGQRGLRVVVRAHPSCRDQLTWQLPANAVVSEVDLASDLTSAAAVVAFNTKVTFSAAAFGLPIATLAPNPIEPSGYSHIVRSDDELEGFLDGVRCGEAQPNAHDLDTFVGWLTSDFMIAERVAVQASTVDEVVERLRSLIVTSPEMGEQPRVQHQPCRTEHINIVEVSRLKNKRLRYSGIAVAQRSLARELARLPDSNSYFLIETEVGPSGNGVDVGGVAELANSTGGRVIVANRKDRDRLLADLNLGDVYHSTHRELPARRITGTAHRALTIHDVIHEYRPGLDALSGVPYITTLLDKSEAVDRYVCDSDQTRRDLIRARNIDPGATCVIELGTEAQSDCPTTRFTASSYVLVLAQASRRKNMTNIAQALNLVIDDASIERDLALVIAGGDTAIDAVVRHFSPASLANVRVCSEPSQAELGQLFRDAEVCLFGSEFEGFGLIPLEAMAYGCPVVTPWNSSLGEVCGSAVEYALSPSPDDLYRATRNVLLSPQLQAELRSEGLRRAGLYSWKNSALAHAAMYDDLRLETTSPNAAAAAVTGD